MTTIYLIRHGEIAAAAPRRFVGRLDLAMTEKGHRQMRGLARWLAFSQAAASPSPFFQRVVCSPLDRCRQGADILCSRLGGAPEVIEELAEIDLGAWEGLTAAEVRDRLPGAWEARGRDLAGYRPKGGESFGDLMRRVWPVLARIAGDGDAGRVAVVAHAGVNRVLLCRLLGMDLANLFRLEQ